VPFLPLSGCLFGNQRSVRGASGTGKTIAPEAVANDLQLEVYRIDRSTVVNK
jgi:hypothetical protein